MKYDEDLYIDSGFYDVDMDGEYQKRSEKIVKCRKPHECMGGCGKEIKAGELRFNEPFQEEIQQYKVLVQRK